MKITGKFIVILVFAPLLSLAQQKETLAKKLDSLGIKAESLQNGKQNNINPAVYDGAKLDVGTYFTLLGDDLKQQVTSPFHTQGKDWLKVSKFALLTGAVAW